MLSDPEFCSQVTYLLNTYASNHQWPTNASYTLSDGTVVNSFSALQAASSRCFPLGSGAQLIYDSSDTASITAAEQSYGSSVSASQSCFDVANMFIDGGNLNGKSVLVPNNKGSAEALNGMKLKHWFDETCNPTKLNYTPPADNFYEKSPTWDWQDYLVPAVLVGVAFLVVLK